MKHEPTEDVPYALDDFAFEDKAALDGDVDDGTSTDEELSAESKLVKDLRSYLKEAESEHNTFDIIDLTEQAKMTPTQQIAVHKLVVQHLRNIGNVINNIAKES